MGKHGTGLRSLLGTALAFALFLPGAAGAASIAQTVVFEPHESDGFGGCLVDTDTGETICAHESEYGFNTPGVRSPTIDGFDSSLGELTTISLDFSARISGTANYRGRQDDPISTISTAGSRYRAGLFVGEALDPFPRDDESVLVGGGGWISDEDCQTVPMGTACSFDWEILIAASESFIPSEVDVIDVDTMYVAYFGREDERYNEQRSWEGASGVDFRELSLTTTYHYTPVPEPSAALLMPWDSRVWLHIGQRICAEARRA